MNEEIMDEEKRQKILSNEYVDLIIEYSGSVEIMKQYEEDTNLYVDNKYAIVYAPLAASLLEQTDFYSYSVIPKLYGLLDTTALEDMGVNKLQSTTALALRGEGVLLGFLDTGIDYINPIFQYEDGTTRILALWDQTIEVGRQSYDAYFYGTEYRRSEINKALKSEEPLLVVPSVDEDGHGTRLAGLAGGRRGSNISFSGVASEAEYIVVKLRGAKPHLREHFGVKEEAPCYAESDIMLALRYLVSVAQESGRPIAICIVVAAGNEGNTGHHYYGEIDNNIGFHNVEIQVGKEEVDFSMELWGNVPGDNLFAITVSAYNHKTKNIYGDASRGYTRYNISKPEVVAPGVNILSPHPGGGFKDATGTSLGAAFVTGIGALMLEWGMVKGYDKTINTVKIKRHIIRESLRNDF